MPVSAFGWGDVPSGLFLIPEFVTPAEETLLLQCLDPYPWEIYNCRHVMHFGFEWDYGTSGINLAVPRLPFPQVSIPVVQRMRKLPALLRQRLLPISSTNVDSTSSTITITLPTGSNTEYKSAQGVSDGALSNHTAAFVMSKNSKLGNLPSLYESEFVPNQLTINKYLAGHSIPPHVDTHSACHEVLVSLSLGSSTVMEFSPAPVLNRNWNPSVTTTSRFQIALPPRSLLVLSGEARYAWTHAIRGRKSDRIDGVFAPRDTRVSWTFRTSLQPDTCHCNFPEVCDDITRREEKVQ